MALTCRILVSLIYSQRRVYFKYLCEYNSRLQFRKYRDIDTFIERRRTYLPMFIRGVFQRTDHPCNRFFERICISFSTWRTPAAHIRACTLKSTRSRRYFIGELGSC